MEEGKELSKHDLKELKKEKREEERWNGNMTRAQCLSCSGRSTSACCKCDTLGI